MHAPVPRPAAPAAMWHGPHSRTGETSLRLIRSAACVLAVAATTLLSSCGESPVAPDPTTAVPTTVAPAISALVVAPTTLAARSVSPSAVTLTWKDKSSDEAAFEIWRSTTGQGGAYSLRGTAAANTKIWKDTALSTAREYCYRVRATASGGGAPSEFTSSACATTWLRPPTNPTASPASATAITLGWTDQSASESGFEIWRSTTGAGGTYTLLTTAPANSLGADDLGLVTGSEYCYQARAVGAPPIPPSVFSAKACATPTATTLTVRIVLFGDSNTDRCEDVQPPNRISSYVSVVPRLAPTDASISCSVPGKVQAAWEGLRPEAIRVVNHAIASSTTGGGGFGGPNRTSRGAPNARLKVAGFTRFEAEVLGKGYPWSGGEPTNSSFPTGPVQRVNAYVPGLNDFVYVSMGTNDDAGADRTMTAAETEANLRWMIGRWTAAGRAADHFILTTLAPRDDANLATSIPDRNALIRTLATETGVHLVDLAAYTSDDDGAAWRTPSLNIGDGIHYTEPVRAWLGEQVVAWMSAEVPAGP